MPQADLGRADLHLHTRASDGLMSARALVDYAEEHTDLDVIAVTDHDEIVGACEAREWAVRRGYRVQVVPGVEVTTSEGHLLALFIEDRPTALQPLHTTAEWVLKRGGVCVAPHPFTHWTHSLTARSMAPAIAAGLISAIEVLNASPAGRSSRTRAVRFADEQRLSAVGGSDAHMLNAVGLAYTRFHGHDADQLKRSIRDGTTFAEGRFASPREVASEVIPQLALSMVQLPLRRVARFARGHLVRDTVR